MKWKEMGRIRVRQSLNKCLCVYVRVCACVSWKKVERATDFWMIEGASWWNSTIDLQPNSVIIVSIRHGVWHHTWNFAYTCVLVCIFFVSTRFILNTCLSYIVSFWSIVWQGVEVLTNNNSSGSSSSSYDLHHIRSIRKFANWIWNIVRSWSHVTSSRNILLLSPHVAYTCVGYCVCSFLFWCTNLNATCRA